MEWLWDIHLCVYSCLVPSSFIMNGLGIRVCFLHYTYSQVQWPSYTSHTQHLVWSPRVQPVLGYAIFKAQY